MYALLKCIDFTHYIMLKKKPLIAFKYNLIEILIFPHFTDANTYIYTVLILA